MLTGRQEDIEQIAGYCEAGRFVVLACEPGLGATVLLEQGVIPELMRRGFITVCFNEYQGRLFATGLKEKIAQAVREQADDRFFAEVESLSEMLARIKARTERPLALIFDQFEDYVRCHSGTDVSDDFDADFSRAVADRQATFVVAIHKQATHDFQRLSQYIPNLLGTTVELQGLSEDAARTMLSAQAEAKGMTIAPEATDSLVQAPAAQFLGRLHPYYLTAGLNRLMEAAREKKSTVLTMETVEAYGNADRLIRESLDDKITELRPSHMDLFFRWGNILISPEGQRLGVSEKGLLDYSGKLNRFGMTLLTRLMQLGLLRNIETSNGTRYEFARASMAPLVKDWWKRHESELIARQKRRFRIRSISLAVGSLGLIYLVWLIVSWTR
ncbi:MAG: hypothetical protein KGN84_11055 [Acidobacteriota bacterium]|nr:hypothetical protein [Acidobacteriota bacterium]